MFEQGKTLPAAPREAFKDHGKPHASLQSGLEDALAHRDKLRSLGIDLEEVGETLQVAGVSAFAKAFEGLLGVIETRRAACAG